MICTIIGDMVCSGINPKEGIDLNPGFDQAR